MRNQLFVDYWPVGTIGPLKCDPVSAVAPEPEWKPMPGHPGYESRPMSNGMDEVRATPGTLPDAKAAPTAQKTQRDPPYIPDGFESFTYHDAKGHDTTITRPTVVGVVAACVAILQEFLVFACRKH